MDNSNKASHKNISNPRNAATTKSKSISPNSPTMILVSLKTTDNPRNTITLNPKKATAKTRLTAKPPSKTPKKPPINVERKKYSKYWDFLFSSLGAVIGFGNIATFPTLAALHGGGSFLIVYLIYVLLVGLPMTCAEMFLGQLSGLGVGKTVGLMSPMFQGVGWGIVCLTFVINIYYSMRIAYCIFYFFMSLKTILWSDCHQSWNTPLCCSLKQLREHSPDNEIQRCLNFNNTNLTSRWSTEEFFDNYVLEINATSLDYGTVSSRLLTTFSISWCIAFVILYNGIRISSKVSYVTVLFPFFGLLLLFITCLTQDGAANGLVEFFVPDRSQMQSFRLWVDAICQILWSLNIGSGMTTALTSYNPFHNNCERDALIVVFVDSFASIFAGMTAFAGTGAIAHDLNISVKELLLRSGKNIGFVVYPEIVSRMPGAQFWSALFFLMAIATGLATQIWLTETVIVEIADVFTQCRAGKFRIMLVAIVCAVSFLLGISFCLKGTGAILYFVFSQINNGWCTILLAFLEIAIVVYVYGYNRFSTDISLITGLKPNRLWRIVFTITAPLMLLILLILILYDDKHLPLEQAPFAIIPMWYSLFWSVSAATSSLVLLFAAYHIIKNFYKKKPLHELILPSKHWCPRKKSDLEIQKTELESAQKGIMGEFELPIDEARQKFSKH